MHLQGMAHHLVLSRKWSIIASLTPVTVAGGAPKDCLLGRVSSVIMSIEVVPAAERSSPASWESAVEAEDLRVARDPDGAYVGGGRLGCS